MTWDWTQVSRTIGEHNDIRQHDKDWNIFKENYNNQNNTEKESCPNNSGTCLLPFRTKH